MGHELATERWTNAKHAVCVTTLSQHGEERKGARACNRQMWTHRHAESMLSLLHKPNCDVAGAEEIHGPEVATECDGVIDTSTVCCPIFTRLIVALQGNRDERILRW